MLGIDEGRRLNGFGVIVQGFIELNEREMRDIFQSTFHFPYSSFL